MASTGEVGCLGDDFEEAFFKAMLSVGYSLPTEDVLLSTGPVDNKAAFPESSRILRNLGVRLYATRGTGQFLAANGVEAIILHWPLEEKRPKVMEYLSQRRIDLVINIPKNYQEEELTNDYIIRWRAMDFGLRLITDIQVAQRFVQALTRKRLDDLLIKSWGEYKHPLAA